MQKFLGKLKGLTARKTPLQQLLDPELEDEADVLTRKHSTEYDRALINTSIHPSWSL